MNLEKISESPVAPVRKDAGVIARGAVVNFLTLIAKLGRPLFYFLAARLYGTESYGLYFLAWTYIELLAGIATLGLDRGILRYIAHHNSLNEPHLEEDSFRTALHISTFSSAFMSLCLYFFANPLSFYLHNEKLALPLQWMAFIVFFQAVSRILIQVPTARKIMKYQFYLKGLLEPLLLTLLAVVFSRLGWGLRGLCAAHFITMALVLFGSILATLQYFPLRLWFHHSQSAFHWELFHFSRSMLLSDIVSNLNLRLDVILLGTVAPSTVMGIYGVMVQIASVMQTIRLAFDPIANPLFSEAYARREMTRLSRTYKLLTRWVILSTIPVLIMLSIYGADIAGMVGSQYRSGYPWLLILLSGTMILAFFGLSGYLLAMTGHPGTLLISNTVSLLVTGTFLYLTVHWLGPLGAAVGSAFVMIFSQSLLSWAVHKRLHIHAFSKNLWKPVAAGFLTAMILFFIPLSLHSPVWNVAIHFPILLALYLGFLFLFSLEEEENKLLRGLSQKIRRVRLV